MDAKGNKSEDYIERKIMDLLLLLLLLY